MVGRERPDEGRLARRPERVPETERARYRRWRKQTAPLRRVGRQLWTGLRMTFALMLAWSVVLLGGVITLLYFVIQWLRSP